MKVKRYRQKAEIAHRILQGMSSGPAITSRLCSVGNINVEILHSFLDSFFKQGYIIKKQVLNKYNGKIIEYSLTGTGWVLMDDLNNINKRLAWLYSI